VYSGASVGLAFYPSDAPTSEALLRYADMAMTAADLSDLLQAELNLDSSVDRSFVPVSAYEH
jgi:predicted signal transduction protein with EAL and GGDEF domain